MSFQTLLRNLAALCARASRAIFNGVPMRRFIAACLAAAALGAASAALAQSRPVSVEIDHSTRVQLGGPAGTVIVGNPAIADVTVVDANTLFITGRGYGLTEIVVVDTIGRTIFQGNVVVTAPQSGHVRVWRGASATDMACAASCAPSVRTSGASGSPTP